MDVLRRMFSCNCQCVQKNIYTILAIASLVMMAGSVAGSEDRKMRMQELKYLIIYLIVAVFVFLLLEWLCENKHYEMAWGVSVLPLLAAIIHGYRMAQSGHVESNNLPRMFLQRYNLL